MRIQISHKISTAKLPHRLNCRGYQPFAMVRIQGKLHIVIMSLHHEFCAKHLFTPSAVLTTGNKRASKSATLNRVLTLSDKYCRHFRSPFRRVCRQFNELATAI